MKHTKKTPMALFTTLGLGLFAMAAVLVGLPQEAMAGKCKITIKAKNDGKVAIKLTQLRYRASGDKKGSSWSATDSLAAGATSQGYARTINTSCKETWFFTVKATCKVGTKTLSRSFKFKRLKTTKKDFSVTLKVNGKKHKWKSCK